MAHISFDQFYNTAVQGQAKNSTIKLNGNNGVKTTGWPTWKSTNRAAIDGFLESITISYGKECSDIIRESLDMRAKPKPLKARQIIAIKTQLDAIQKNFQALDAYFAPNEMYDDSSSPAEAYLDSLLSEYKQEAGSSFEQLYEQKGDMLEEVQITLTENIQNHQAFSEEDAKACIRQELQSHLPQIYMENFFAQGMNNEPSPAEAYLDDLLNNYEVNDGFPQEQLEYLKNTVIRTVKKTLTENIHAHKTYSPDNAKESIAKTLNELHKDIQTAFNSHQSKTGKPLDHAFLRCLSSFKLDDSIQYSLMADFLSDVVQALGNDAILNRSLANSKQLYEELCSRLGDTPEDLATEQSIDTINDKIAQKLQQLQRKNQKLGNQLKSLSQSFKPNASLETLAPELRSFHQACLDAIDQLLQKRPDLKELLPKFNNEQDIVSFFQNDNKASLALDEAINRISKQPKIVTAELFSNLLQQTFADRLFNAYAEQELKRNILPTLNLNNVPPKHIKDSITAIIPKVPIDLKISFCSLSLKPEQLQKTKKTIHDSLVKSFSIDITHKQAVDATIKNMKEAIKNNSNLTNEEIETIDFKKTVDSFNIMYTGIKNNIIKKGEEPQIQVFMDAYKEHADQFIALKTNLIKNLESLQNKLDSDTYKEMRAEIIKNPNYIKADMPLRAYDIASKLDVSALQALGPKPSIQDVKDAFLHLALRINILKNDEEKLFEPFAKEQFNQDILTIACKLHPELLDTMYQVSMDDLDEIRDTFFADSNQLSDEYEQLRMHEELSQSYRDKLDSLRLEVNTTLDVYPYAYSLYQLATEKHQSEVNVQ